MTRWVGIVIVDTLHNYWKCYRLGWEYLFGTEHPDWACVHTTDGMWIVTDEACDLDNAMVYPDDDAFVEWLDNVAKENLDDNSVEFLSCFVRIPALITPEVHLP